MDGSSPARTDALTDVERDLLAAVGWAATHRPAALDGVQPELFAHAARRHIAQLILQHVDRHGATCWTAVNDELVDDGDQDATLELLQVVTSDGWPAAIPALVQRLRQAADDRQAWADAVTTLRDIAGGPVTVEIR